MPKSRPRKIDYLLVDVSNSFTKIAFSTTKRVGASIRMPTARLTRSAFQHLFQKRQANAVIVSSVVPKKNAAIRSAAAGARVLFIDTKCELGVGVDYAAPRTIGADRLANAAAVAQLYGQPAIVVDFGTAVTFDVVSADGNYVGGVIAPGLEAMTSFLYHRTALLPKLTLREPGSAIGKTTRGAMMSGAIYGYRGLVREIIARIANEMLPGRKVRVVATGGYAQLIARQLPEIEAVHPGLTLEGLRLIANLNLEARGRR
ncbi:MAG: type III pantothenate kinase [Verrucomicrobiota bacterium]|nr:type III pantothenate kinase [Verrucomicrobiota bacterium]